MAPSVAVAATPAPTAPAADPESPVVVSQPPVAPSAHEVDQRPDFSGRALPPAHVEGQHGTDTVSAEAAFTKPVSESPAGFSNLFGWRREDTVGDNDTEEDQPKIVSSPEDHPKATPFDDEDLEIPAFLRRSANT